MRLIDADTLIEKIKNYPYGYRGMIEADIAQMPTAEPQWIPVSERLPKNDDWCIVTILYERGDSPLRYTDFGWYLEEENCWIVGAEKQWTGVVAWMPLPEPWRGEEG